MVGAVRRWEQEETMRYKQVKILLKTLNHLASREEAEGAEGGLLEARVEREAGERAELEEKGTHARRALLTAQVVSRRSAAKPHKRPRQLRTPSIESGEEPFTHINCEA